MGISELPDLGCNTKNISDELSLICDIEHLSIVSLPYNSYFQEYLAPAGYVRNTADINSYLTGATFLPALNNEKGKGTKVFK